MDVRSDMDYHQSQRTPMSKRKRLIESVRRKFRSKSKDRNQNLRNLSRSQPNISNGSHSSYVALDEYDHEPMGFHSRSYHAERDSFDRTDDYSSMTLVRSRSQSRNTRGTLEKQKSVVSSGSSVSPPGSRKFTEHESLTQQSSLSDASLTPPGSGSQFHLTNPPHRSSEDMELEDKEENDSAIEVVETSSNTQEVSD